MAVRQLSESTINRIAAGEVIERPASVVKELVENALDAGARRIEVVTAGGGKTLIRVTDDGAGMTRPDLELAVERHCTSKLREDDLLDIRTLGFRGEALPSIGSVAELSIETRHADEPHGWGLAVSGGAKDGPRPVALAAGTRVEVRNLFFATPARLKFLKTDRAEAGAATEIVKRLALAHPAVRFEIAGADRSPLDYPAVRDGDPAVRIGQVMGREFAENAIPVEAVREGVRLSGLAGLGTFQKANSLSQYLFVNGRPVQDKLLLGAVRAGYADVMARDRYPAVALYVEIDPHEVDVNVHPTKADVRFRDPGLVRGLIVGALRQAHALAGHRASSTHGAATLDALAEAIAADPPAVASGARRPGSAPSWSSRPAAAFDWRSAPERPLPTEVRPAGFANPVQPRFDAVAGAVSADARADAADPSPDRSAPRAPRSTRPTSSPRPPTVSSSSTSTPPTSGWSTSG